MVKEKPKPPGQKTPNPDVVIERYHELYERRGTTTSRDATDRISERSLDSDNFSMCSDVIRDMNTHAEHHVPDSEYEDADVYV